MSTAPDLKTLLDFETQIETACAGIIEDELDISAASVNITLDQDSLVTPRVEVSFEAGEALDAPVPRNQTGAKIDYDKHTGTLTLRLITDGSVNGTQSDHRQKRGQLRAAFLISEVGFNEVNLPYYEIRYLRPTGTAFSVDGDHQVSELTYQVEFGFTSDAWPDPEPEPDPE